MVAQAAAHCQPLQASVQPTMTNTHQDGKFVVRHESRTFTVISILIIFFTFTNVNFKPAHAIDVNVCDCTNSQFVGIINLGSYRTCHLEKPVLRSTLVQYSVYQKPKFEKSFKGHVCKMWQSEQTISGSFLGTTDTTNSKKIF